MATRSRLAVLLLLTTLAMAMVAESSFSHLDSTTIAFVQGSNDNIEHVGDMLYEDEEMMMPSESARRTLNTHDHIAYRAMRANQIPCNQRGASYYHCNRMSKINPYRRGCQRITNCARRNS
ncbi:protein RALF-like 22 [Solanum dulcamara]|uniref:protein RALF-like 22 n=1 Tax=Solanum dulcamara TaxID=45834 RepID=UPI002485F218|nr:protein RALF-like 22 [Solanum dulcamara]